MLRLFPSYNNISKKKIICYIYNNDSDQKSLKNASEENSFLFIYFNFYFWGRVYFLKDLRIKIFTKLLLLS